ncbi:hypothetical protein K9U39_08665 [Rhodoblastus acidophilus]|uniref:Secreted protein n=1 Tax=Candidatus Rhodoblastus alkanivorans TaxID=2954117 RepID=A0ABS9Z7R4_9HYPH|nr:hypothetical protein [Candidatus Rhodoblastus alkanivorans]MCI4679663.1 hypothetical protein [Candidatus Rhodoblastus alkanivorans]MCI4683699.1 hypothetical protein [Candidatus Rhodoblastus alkanivorans]MDI4641016.1 hypothetical protein [Rhodoblastus acidophilus]
MFVRLLAGVALAVPIWGASPSRLMAQQASIEEGFDIRGIACNADGRCASFRQRTQAATRMQCQSVAGMFGMAEWQSQHPDWTVKEWHCAARGEHDL